MPHGLYFKHVQNWLKYFPRETFLFINREELRREPLIIVINPLNETNVCVWARIKEENIPSLARVFKWI